MTQRQYEIIRRIDDMIKPLDIQVADLEEFCSDGRKVVAPITLEICKEKRNNLKGLKLMIMEEFLK